MDDGLSKKPWEHHSYKYTHSYYSMFHGLSGPHQCPAEFQTIKDSARLGYRKCDLIKYKRKHRYDIFGDWRDWFPIKPKKKRIEINTKVPTYLSGQYGIVIQRFRKTKDKGIVYNDYGILILLLTGKHKGMIKQWSVLYPFHTISKFPYINPLPKILTKNLTKILGNDPVFLCKNIQQYNEEQRDLFLEKIWNYFTGEIK